MKTEHEKACELHRNLEKTQPVMAQVMSTDRGIPRKEQAKLARKLFRSLGLQGISVITPNYSMAQSVHVNLPRCEHDTGIDWSYHESKNCALCQRELSASRHVEAILAVAFPNHDNRSDSRSDYFDFCWSIN